MQKTEKEIKIKESGTQKREAELTEQELEGIEEKLRWRTRELEALYETSLEINAQPNLAALLNTIVERAAVLLDASMGGLYLTEPDGDAIRLAVGYNLQERYIGTKLGLGEGLSGRVALSGEPLMVEDYRSWEGRAPVYEGSPYRRVLGVPLKIEDRVIGVINITDDEKVNRFNEDEIRMVSLFADQAAYAIEKARLHEAASEELAKRRSVEEALRVSEQQHRMILEAMGDSIHVVDQQLRFVYANKRFLDWNRELGLSTEIIGRELFEVFYFLPAPVRDEYSHVFQTGEMFTSEDRTQLLGKEIFTETRKIPIIEDGKVIQIVTIIRDRSKRRLAEEAIEKSELRFRSLVEKTAAGIATTDVEGNSTFVNQSLCKMIGRSEEELTGKPFIDFLHPEDKARLESLFHQPLKYPDRENSLEFRIIHKDGKTTYCISQPTIFIHQGEVIGFNVIIQNITRQKQAEQALRQEINQAQQYLDTANVILVALDKQGDITLMNRKGHQILGYPEGDLTGCNWFDTCLPKYNRKQVKKVFRHLMTENIEALEYYENPIMTRAGEERLIAWHNTIIKDQNRKPVGTLSSGEDITERKRAEKALRESEDRLRERNQFLSAMNEISQIALTSQDVQATMQVLVEQLKDLTLSDQCYITGWDSERRKVVPIAASGELSNIYPQIQNEPNEPTITEAVLLQGRPLIVENTQDSEYTSAIRNAILPTISILGAPLRTIDQDLGAIIIGYNQSHHFTEEEIAYCEQAASLYSLIIARLRLREESQRHTDELEILVSNSAAMRITKTRVEIPQVILNQLLRQFKAEGAALLVQDVETGSIKIDVGAGSWGQFTGLNIPMEIAREIAIEKFSKPFLSNDVPNLLDELNVKYSPQLEAIAGAPLIADNQLLGGLYFGRQTEISETELRLLTAVGDIMANALHRATLHEDLENHYKMLQRSQAQLIQSEKLAAIGELVAGVAHELNNPLTSVVLYSQMIQSKFKDKEISRDLTIVVEEAQRASKIVRGLLGFARQRPPERKPVQINDVLQSALELMSYELRMHNIRTSTRYATRLPYTMADPYQLQQVFINLFTNSRQALQEKAGEEGVIHITTQVSPSTFGVQLADKNRVIRILFNDNGPGISPEDLSHIFDPFFTTKEAGQGSGLGLSVCHGIISEHGGHIWAESELGKGATFFIELPIVKPEELTELRRLPITTTSSISASEETIRILVIDDETKLLYAIKQTLEENGYEVDAVSSGAAGLELLEKTRYDLILCDVRMPEISGPDLHKFISEKDPEMVKRILFTSGDIASQSTRNFLEKSGIPCLDKPFELDELLETVNTSLEGLT